MALSWLRPPAIAAVEMVSAGVDVEVWWKKCDHISFKQLRVMGSPSGGKEGVEFG